MKKILILSSILLSAICVSQIDSSFASIENVQQVKAANFAQMKAQEAKTIFAENSYKITLAKYQKLYEEKAIVEQKIIQAAKELESKKTALDAIKTTTNQMQQARTDSANSKVIAKEQNRINTINNKASVASEKLEIDALKAKYEAKLNIAMPGLTKKYARYKEIKRFDARNSELINSGVVFEQRKATLMNEFGIN